MLDKIDHVVITTAYLSDCLRFYQALGFEARKDGVPCAPFTSETRTVI